MDLHGYGHWSCQLALLAGLRTMYHRFMQPNGRFPNSDLVVSSCCANLLQDFCTHAAPDIGNFPA